MNKIYETIIRALDELELHYQRDDENLIVDANLQCDSASFRIRFAALEDQELLYCFSLFPLNIPADKRPAMCEMINAINYENVVGMLVMDPEDGQLSCRMPCTVDEGVINTTIVKVALQTTLRGLNDNYAAILKILAS